MMTRLLNQLKLDALLLWRNKFAHVSLLVAVVFIVLVRFLVPAEVKAGVHEYVFDGTEGRIFADFLAREASPGYVKGSEEELRRAVEADPNSVGIILKGSPKAPQALVITQGHENPRVVKLLGVSLEALWEEEGGLGRTAAHSTTYLYPGAPRVGFNLLLLPLLVAFESVFLGFYFAAVMVFQEKEEGGIRAYRVSPGGAPEYIASKVLVNVGLGLLSAMLMVGATLGAGVPYGQLALLVAAAAVFMTLLGLGLGVFFSSLSGFIYPAFFVMTIFSLPAAAYFFPVFKFPLQEWIITYPVMFGLREILFSTGRVDLLTDVFRVLLPQGAAAAVFCYLAVQKRLMREAV